ncbi:MAG: hypothetical protein KC613_22290, partial [Myxococcales bacterium]|nr:hypothetical protein [Myxococcales bacterium]
DGGPPPAESALLKPASKPADLPAPTRGRKPAAPGPVRDSDDDDSWGVAGAEMPKGATTARKASARRTAPVGGSRASGASSGTNIVTVAVAVLVVVGGLVAWRLLARKAEVEEALERDRVKPTIEMTAAEAAAKVPAAPQAAPDVGPAEEDAGVDKENAVLVIVKPGGARFMADGNPTPVCAEADRCWLPVDVDYKIEKKGYKTRAVSGDDLFDRKGNKWTLLLHPEK